MTPIYQKLITIRENQSFEELESFKNPAIWTEMAIEEKELLALLLNRQGAQHLAKGDHKVLDIFDLASQVYQSPAILYDQGIIFACHSDNSRCLSWANQAFAKALEGNPAFFLGWYKRAQVLIKLGLLDGESHYLVEADQLFEQAAKWIEQQEKQADFYWHWGYCLSVMGRHSGEPLDFHRAIQKYQRALQFNIQDAHFYNDYGHALADQASLLEKSELFIEALDMFNEAIRLDSQQADSWYNQACCLHRLCELTQGTEYFDLAQESLAKAIEMNPQSGQLWLKSAQLDAMIGKFKREQKRIETSLEKFTKAYEFEPDFPVILSCWGEIELFLGSYQENLELIQSAKAKIIKSLELYPEMPDVWYLYGSCLNELGRYFNEEEYYLQAIEKYHYGLSLGKNNPLLWYGLALSNFALAEMHDDASLYEKTHRYCNRVIECGGGALAQFWNDWGVTLLKLAEATNQPHLIETAIEKFERALNQPLMNLEPDDIDLEWVYNYGCAFDLLGDLTDNPRHFEKAIQILSQVLQLDSDYTHARYNLALAYSHLAEATSDIESYDKAVEHFQVLLENDAEDELAHMDLGVSLTNLSLLVQEAHQPEKAEEFYRQAEMHLMQAMSLGNQQAYYQLAGLYSLTKHYSNAMYYMEKAQMAGTLPLIEDMMHDDWLEGLRQTQSFKQFINQLSSQQSMDEK